MPQDMQQWYGPSEQIQATCNQQKAFANTTGLLMGWEQKNPSRASLFKVAMSVPGIDKAMLLRASARSQATFAFYSENNSDI